MDASWLAGQSGADGQRRFSQAAGAGRRCRAGREERSASSVAEPPTTAKEWPVARVVVCRRAQRRRRRPDAGDRSRGGHGGLRAGQAEPTTSHHHRPGNVVGHRYPGSSAVMSRESARQATGGIFGSLIAQPRGATVRENPTSGPLTQWTALVRLKPLDSHIGGAVRWLRVYRPARRNGPTSPRR